jgi:diaminohydroxyphosphoribosylaminopyrimidine deaminase/5-amino-6-(5-phosphoribosylamino)uracil reductase
MKKIKNHNYFMRLAMKEAMKTKTKTSPNPMVGALVVSCGKIISRGYHKKAGLPHAEIVALNKAKNKAKGANLYITLEPCAHFGRTPACVDSIIRSGIKKVFIGMVDPNPLNNGKGISILKKHGIKVEVGFLEDELIRMNEVFIKYITKRLPFVTVKVAQSLDGKIATRSGDSKWISSDRSRELVHRYLRRDSDAVMVGVNTILRDNPKLGVWFSENQPVKIIVDTELSTPQDASVFLENSKVVIVTLASASGQETENRNILARKAKILEVKGKVGQVNLKDMMKKLAAMEITSIFVEGGGTLIGSLFDEGLVDKVLFFVSPIIIGGKEATSSVMGRGVSRIDESIKLKRVKLRRIAEDYLIEGYV